MIEAPRPGPAPRWRAGSAYFSLDGLARVRSFSEGSLPRPAAYQTVGMRPVRVDAGDVEYGLADSGWLAGRDGAVSVAAIAFFLDAPVTNPVHTTIGAGMSIRTVRLSIDFHGAARPGEGPFTSRGTLAGVSDGIGLGEARLVTASGDLMATSTCRTVILDPSEREGGPDNPVPVEVVDGPWSVPAPAPNADIGSPGLEYLEEIVDGGDQPPFWALLGAHPSEAEPGRAVLAMPADPWLGTHVGILYGGVTASFGVAAAEAALWTGDGAGERTRVLAYTHNFTRMVQVGEPVVIAEAHVVHRGRTLAVADVELQDSEGRRVGLGRATGLVGTVSSHE